jgi:hypothetical protein
MLELLRAILRKSRLRKPVEVPKTSALHNQNSLLHSARRRANSAGNLLRGVIGSTTVSGTVSWGSSPYGVSFSHKATTRTPKNIAFFGVLVVYEVSVPSRVEWRARTVDFISRNALAAR